MADGKVPPGALVRVDVAGDGETLSLHADTSGAAPARAGTSRPVVLAIDENESLLKTLEHALAGAGVAPLTAASGQQARDLAAQHRLDLAIVDVVLSDGDGLSVALELLRIHPRLQVLVTTGMELSADEAALCDRQDFPVLRKPFLAEDVVNLVRARLQRSSAAGG